jgi:lipoprotein-anchoring transpeptidase ErfK/SrfK
VKPPSGESGILRGGVARIHVYLSSVAALGALCSVLALAPAASAARPDVVLSNETTSSTWTVADYAQPIRSRPSASAPKIASLQFQTPDGFLQSYILLREHWTHGTAWVELRIPGRPNGRVGWAQRSALDGFNHTDMEVVVNRAARRLTLYRGGKVIFQAPVGVGKPSTPTPAGHFWITEAFVSHDPFYGPYAFGTSDYSTLTEWKGGGIVGLHGTNEPQLIPGDPSHGCIRLRNSDILRMSRLVSIGTPLLVQ